MKRFTTGILTGLFMIGLIPTQAVQAAEDGEKEVLYWVAPMDPNYKRDKPGKSPMGMELIPFYAGADDEGPGITIRPEVIQNLGVRLATAENTRLWRGIDTVAYVDFDESRVSHIHLRTKGWIEKLNVQSQGERVKKGQRLFNLYSPELVNAQEEFVQALQAGNRGLIRASRNRLNALGIPLRAVKQLEKTRKVKQTVEIYAPQDGVVSALKVREGMYVKPSMRIMTLADLSSIWILAEVFERQTDWVKLGQPAEIRLAYLPGEVWEGRVEYIYPSLDPKTRTLKVRLVFDNPGEKLKPNMYAHIKIFGGAKENTIVIPIEALIRTGREERVILAKGEGRFEARLVTAGIESGKWVEIKEGIADGDKVVVSGQFLLDSEASMKASVTRMTPLEDSDEAGEPEQVSGSGVIESMMPAHGMLTLRHEPIDELGWPAMTMDFLTADGVNLSELKPGDSVMFTLNKQDDKYVITTIHTMTNQEM
ncbi:MAG TPA: efflux RND transporter periplasmic adaptor subunit [Gammaproteobacteria bacterium]|nr:efflux RND transporter periplasmic adaptor subunit [Gammaproteobacteria bacterium]